MSIEKAEHITNRLKPSRLADTWCVIIGEKDNGAPVGQVSVYVQAVNHDEAKYFAHQLIAVDMQKPIVFDCRKLHKGMQLDAVVKSGQVITYGDPRHPHHIDSPTRPPMLPIYSVTFLPTDHAFVSHDFMGHDFSPNNRITIEADDQDQAVDCARVLTGIADDVKASVDVWKGDSLESWKAEWTVASVPPCDVIRLVDPRHPDNHNYGHQANGRQPRTMTQKLTNTELGRGVLAIVKSRIPDAPDDLLNLLPPVEWLRQYLLAHGVTHDAGAIMKLAMMLTRGLPAPEKPKVGDFPGLDALIRQNGAFVPNYIPGKSSMVINPFGQLGQVGQSVTAEDGRVVVSVDNGNTWQAIDDTDSTVYVTDRKGKTHVFDAGNAPPDLMAELMNLPNDQLDALRHSFQQQIAGAFGLPADLIDGDPWLGHQRPSDVLGDLNWSELDDTDNDGTGGTDD